MNQDSLAPQPLPQNAPRPFSEIPPLWMQLPRMDRQFFAGELQHTSPLNTFFGVAIYSVIGTLAVLLVSVLQRLTRPSELPPGVENVALVIGCLMLFITPISFYLNSGLNYLSALVFGGKGKFNEQAYLASLFFVPIGIVSSVISLLAVIPVVGPIIEWPLLLVIVIFTTIYQYRAIRVVHSLTSGRAAGAVLAPFGLIVCLCLPVVVIGVLMVLGPVIGNTFSSINQSLLTPVP